MKYPQTFLHRDLDVTSTKSYAQTVLGRYNVEWGTTVRQGFASNNGDPLLIIGNGTGIGSLQSNAFEVSDYGFSIVYHNMGAATHNPIGSVVLGSTHVDNVIYAWGDVPAATGTGAVIPNSSFGIASVTYDATKNRYMVVLAPQSNPDGSTTTNLTQASVTATIENTDPNTDPGCVTIAVSPIQTGNIFYVWTHFVSFSTTQCEPIAYPFSFKVCGRP